QDPRHGGRGLPAADCGAVSKSAPTRSVSEGLAYAERWCPSLHDDALCLAGRGVVDEELFGVGSMQCPWVRAACTPSAVLGGDVRVHVQEIVVLVALLKLPKEPLVVAMGERDVRLIRDEVAERLVQSGADAVNGLTDALTLAVAVAEDEVR